LLREGWVIHEEKKTKVAYKFRGTRRPPAV
jgi:hypothetical protein